MQLGTTKGQGLYSTPSAAVHPGALATGTLPQYITKGIYRYRLIHTTLQTALQPRLGLGLLYNMPPSFSVPCSISPFVYTHLSQLHGHVIQPSHSRSSSSSCCIQLSIQHLFCDCGVLHSFYVTKPSYSLTFNKPNSILSFDYGF